MKREEFLKALEERLQVLNRQEREDIVSEYRQHIELRMESGLTEEEAIGDFGDLDELVAEILDAYSVNPDYGKRQRMPGKESAKAAGEAVLAGTRKAGSAGMRAASALKGWILRVLKGAAGLAGRLWTLLRGGVSAVSRSLRPGRKMALEAQTWERREETFRGNLDTGEIPALREIPAQREIPAPGQNPAPRLPKMGTDRLFKRLFRAVFRLAVLCIQVLGTVFVLLPMAAVDFMGVLLFGGLLVLCVMGYPAAGLTVGAFGGILSCTALILLAADLLFPGRRSRKPAGGPASQPERGEEERAHEA